MTHLTRLCCVTDRQLKIKIKFCFHFMKEWSKCTRRNFFKAF